MATINSADPTTSIIEEVTPGVTPEVGLRYEVPTSTEQAPPVFASAEITSSTKRPNRSSNGTQQGMTSGEWSVETRAQKAAFFDLLLKSALCGEWTSNKLSAGQKDTFFSVITALKANTAVDPAPANGMYYVDAGNIVNSFELSAKSGEGVTASFGVMGLTRVEADEDHEASVTAVEGSANEFTYADLKNVKLYTGTSTYVDLGVSSLSLSVSHEREIRAICGQQEGVDIGTSGARKTSGEINIYRESFQINTDVTGQPQKLTFEVSRGGAGYRFTIPAATFQKPSDALEGSSVMVKLSFSSKFDATAQTDIFVERI